MSDYYPAYIIVFENALQDRYYGPFESTAIAEAFAESRAQLEPEHFGYYSIHRLR